MSDFSKYIGIPYLAGGQGPEFYDCMGFFRLLQKNHFNIEVPIILAPDYNDEYGIAELFNTSEERQKWQKIDKAEHGCAVIVHRPMHIGTWLDIEGGGVLHCVKGIGVIFTKDSSWTFSGFGRREYFRHK